MFETCDIGPDSVYRSTESLEVLRQRMLNQELVFQMQLFELHRLYETQNNLMKEPKRLESYGWCLKQATTLSPSQLLTDPALYLSFVKETPSNAAIGGNSMQLLEEDFSVNLHQLQHKPWLRCPDFKRRPLDLQLPANEFIRLADDDFPTKGSLGNDSLEVTDIELSIGTRNIIIKNNGHDNKRCGIVPRDVIDLQDPSFSRPTDNRSSKFSSGLAASSSTLGAKRHLSHDFIIRSSLSDVGPSYGRQTSLISGFHEQESEIGSNTSFSNRKNLSSSPKALDLDLNTPQVDGSLCFSDNSTILTSEKLPTKAADSSDRKLLITDFKSPCSEEPPNNERQHHKRLWGSAAEISDCVSCHVVEMDEDRAQVTYNKSIEGAISTYPSQSVLGHGNNADTGSRSGNIRTLQSAIQVGHSLITTADELQKASLGSTVGESLVRNPDHLSSPAWASEVDELVKLAAEAIVCISSKAPTYQLVDMSSKEAQAIDNGFEHSSDSYELLVLNQTESGLEDHEVSSKVTEVGESEMSVPSYKLKRGTRMRDFQREILPNLSCLLRHEICEDLGVMENAIRSREYKKLRSKMPNGDNWCMSLRSRRSRTSYRRRCYP